MYIRHIITPFLLNRSQVKIKSIMYQSWRTCIHMLNYIGKYVCIFVYKYIHTPFRNCPHFPELPIWNLEVFEAMLDASKNGRCRWDWLVDWVSSMVGFLSGSSCLRCREVDLLTSLQAATFSKLSWNHPIKGPVHFENPTRLSSNILWQSWTGTGFSGYFPHVSFEETITFQEP